MPLLIVKEDITRVRADVIVNAANRNLRQGGGVCGAIFAAAGVAEMRAACDRIGSWPTGGAVVTPAFKLPAKYVVHAVGPIWLGGFQGEKAQLVSCYQKALKLAAEKNAESIAFPLISSGIYGYPKEKAFRTAMEVISAFLKTREMAVYLSVYDPKAARPEPAAWAELLACVSSGGQGLIADGAAAPVADGGRFLRPRDGRHAEKGPGRDGGVRRVEHEPPRLRRAAQPPKGCPRPPGRAGPVRGAGAEFRRGAGAAGRCRDRARRPSPG